MIANSHVLIVSVRFFNYEKFIKDELISMGARVDLFDERPSNSFYSKAVIRINKFFYQRQINRHFNSIIQKIKDERYNYFLLIKGETTPVFFLKFLKENNPNIKLIYYTFDSFKNNPNGRHNLKYFDKNFTFDRTDAIKYNIGFRPLFFAQAYSKIGSNISSQPLYDISFIGTAHSDRYRLSQSVEKWCVDQNFRMFNFYFSPSKILFALNRILRKDFRNFDRKKISFESLTHTEIIDVYRNSKAILDINHPGQEGLTMRTFETLGAERKLVTTNANIKYYPFYNENNICIIDRQNPRLDKEFFDRKFERMNTDLYYSMSLKGWVKEVFEEESVIWR